MSLPVLRIKPREGKRARAGSPWIFSNEIALDDATRRLEPGAAVDVVLDDGVALGTAMFNPKTLIAARLISPQRGETLDAAFFARRIHAADALRARIFAEPFYRAVHAEADFLPGLIVDRYGDVLSIQLGAAGTDIRTDAIVEALKAVYAPRAIVLRNDFQARTLEGLASETKLAFGTEPGEVAVRENGATFRADPMTGQKTGWFFDQRENRGFAARFVKGKAMLDVFSHAGGFALAALAGGASEALCIDASEKALGLAARSATASGFENRLLMRKADAFEALDDLASQKVTFGLVVADPPAFAKSRKDIENAARAYRKLARQAAATVEPGGTLVMCSCSHHIDAARFHAECAAGIHQARRPARLLRASGADIDHPVHPHLPETAYLKCLVFTLD
ncbi:MAG: class I SAM-dependent rRNA methyltransferase [Alphaproteobacteria bacterium]|nr:class I SAM-dependent rRNA methyltransferase [Alphaproteobacteria bacterium]